MAESVEVDTEGVQALVGRTIVKAERDPPSSDPWPYSDEGLAITLDDGSVWEFSGWGYDASGLAIYVTREAGDEMPNTVSLDKPRPSTST